ncbi:MAG: zf-HC2 domain-containing protein [Corynebacterium sp.]|nr:zf-HC2 domain-containing protein [Corynebacterium sp.]
MISCEQVQAALSARLDGEATKLSDDIVDAHVAGCADCQAFWERAQALQIQLQPAREVGPPPSLEAAILAGVEEESRRRAATRFIQLVWGRIGLVLTGLGFLAVAIHTLSFMAVDDSSLMMDAVALHLSLGVGLFFAAWRPRLAGGMFPVYAALWSFSLGFHMQEIFFGGFDTKILLLLPAVICLAWVWLVDYGIDAFTYSWRQLGSRSL